MNTLERQEHRIKLLTTELANTKETLALKNGALQDATKVIADLRKQLRLEKVKRNQK